MGAEKCGKLRELDYFNAFGCLFVLLIHILSLGISSLDPASWQYAVIYIPHQLAAYVVPAFLFCGAVKMGAAPGGPYLPYILRRFRKVYLPYAVWNVIYFLVLLSIGFVPDGSPAQLLRYIANGTLSGQFYYVLTVMQFYLLMPLWRWAVRRVPWYTGLALSLFVTVLMTRAGSVLALFGGSFPYFDRVFPTYLVFWTAGLYTGRHYDRVRAALTEHRGAVLSLAVMPAVFLLLVYLSRARQIWIYDFPVLKIFSDFAEIFLLLCLCLRLSRSAPAPVGRVLGWIHASSYSVFLSHPLFLTVATWYLQEAGVKDVGTLLLLRALVCCTVPFALCWVTSRTGGLLRRIKPGRAR